MKPNEITIAFFQQIDLTTKHSILDSIAKDYQISRSEALAELVNAEAHGLLEYLRGPIRSATHVLMKRHKLA